jgi:hypothetical protein
MRFQALYNYCFQVVEIVEDAWKLWLLLIYILLALAQNVEILTFIEIIFL